MNNTIVRRFRAAAARSRLRDRGGVALPLALLGLVAVSLLVTTALITSTTELALSSAQQDGSRSLYAAEEGMEAVIADFAGVPQYLPLGTMAVAAGGQGGQVRVTVARMDSSLFAGGDSIQQTFSLVAEQLFNGRPRGRAVAALLRQASRKSDSLNVDITSALTVAGDLHLTGGSFQVSGNLQAADTCASISPDGVEALKKSADSDITFTGKDRWERFSGVNDDGESVTGTDAVETSTLGTAAFVAEIMNGMTIDELASTINPAYKSFRGGNPAYSSGWLQRKLHAHPDSAGVAVVDARGGTVEVGPGTYSGLLIVINGNVDLRGNVDFNGIILVEQNFNIGGSATVNGAVLSFAMDGQNVVEENDSGVGNGSVRVKYDRCTIKRAKENFAGADMRPFRPRTERSYGWFEVVR